jgi:hypothetical protein
MPHHPVRTVPVEQRVAVDAEQDLVAREQRAGPQRERLALVARKMDDAQARALRPCRPGCRR